MNRNKIGIMKNTKNRDKAGMMNKKNQILSSFLMIIGEFNYEV